MTGQPEIAPKPRRPHVETRIRRSQEKPNLFRSEVRMCERQMVPIELFKVCFRDQLLQLFTNGRAGIRRQNFEQGERRIQFDRVFNRRANTFWRVVNETKHVKGVSGDAQGSAMVYQSLLMRLRDR